MADCIIPLSSNETMRDTTTYEYINTYYDYDYISINTMRMFVVLRYWNMDSIYIYIYIYICCHAHMYICIWHVFICIVCVVTHYTVAYLNDATSFALWRGVGFISVLRQKKKKKSLFALVCFLNGLLTDERQIVGDGKKEQVWGVFFFVSR